MSWCNHSWEIKGGYNPGLVYYNGPIVYGTHYLWRCAHCGRQRFKVFTRNKYKVYTRKEVEAAHPNRIKPPRQMEFL